MHRRSLALALSPFRVSKWLMTDFADPVAYDPCCHEANCRTLHCKPRFQEQVHHSRIFRCRSPDCFYRIKSCSTTSAILSVDLLSGRICCDRRER
jgi:hypothetical protein